MMFQEPAYAKLNLALDILGKRPDGYHEMKMVMQSISLHDQIYLQERKEEQGEKQKEKREEEQEGNAILVTTNVSYIPKDQGNLAVKAADRFFTALNRPAAGLALHIDKKIPVCAGMGGGSSDGAAVLRILRRRYAPEMPRETLEDIGGQAGSDVPFCVRGGTVLAQGRGERLSDVTPLPPCWFVVCKPAFSISTPALFAQVRAGTLRCHPDTQGMLAALQTGDLDGIAHRIYNVFEDILPRRYGEIFELKSRLLEEGAMAASMTGSGPAVFGLFSTLETARTAAERIREDRGKGSEEDSVYLCQNQPCVLPL